MNEIEDLARSMTDVYLSNVDAKRQIFSDMDTFSKTYLNCYLAFKKAASEKINATNMQNDVSQQKNASSAFYRSGDLFYDNPPKSTHGR